MKKLGKLSINLNKVMKNEELVNLRGGYGDYFYYYCCCNAYDVHQTMIKLEGFSYVNCAAAEGALMDVHDWIMRIDCYSCGQPY